jgi:hypothetical protein
MICACALRETLLSCGTSMKSGSCYCTNLPRSYCRHKDNACQCIAGDPHEGGAPSRWLMEGRRSRQERSPWASHRPSGKCEIASTTTKISAVSPAPHPPPIPIASMTTRPAFDRPVIDDHKVSWCSKEPDLIEVLQESKVSLKSTCIDHDAHSIDHTMRACVPKG